MNPPVPAHSAELCLSSRLEVQGASGNVEALLGKSTGDLLHMPVDGAVSPELAMAIIQSVAQMRNSGDPAPIEVTPAGVTVSSSPDPSLSNGIRITLSPTETAAPVQEALNSPPAGQHDRDGFLDLAAAAMARGDDVAVTMVQVYGGLNEQGDVEMRRIVHQKAVERGASATSRLDQGTYGILHGASADAEDMLGEITDTARARGVIDENARIGAEQIGNAEAGVDAATIRAVLSDSATTLAGRIIRGLQRFGLRQKVDETKQRVAGLMADVRKALQAGALWLETRPVTSLLRNAVAMHEVRAHPLLGRERIDASVLSALCDSESFNLELQLANIGSAVKHQIDLKAFRGTALRVMASIDAGLISDTRMARRIDQIMGALGADPEKLILRAARPDGSSANGLAEQHLRTAGPGEWRVAVADFYAFIKGDVALDGRSSYDQEPGAYIEVPADRLEGLCAQRDGTYLVKSLIDTWRGRRTEIIATAVNSRKQMEFLQATGVRYAKGSRIGDWQSAT